MEPSPKLRTFALPFGLDAKPEIRSNNVRMLNPGSQDAGKQIAGGRGGRGVDWLVSQRTQRPAVRKPDP
jgi:hypothetical protein